MAFFRKLRIKYQLMFVAFLAVGVMSFIIYITYFQTTNIIVKKNKGYTTEIISQANENIISNCQQIEKIITSIAYDDMVQKFLIEDNLLKKKEMSKSLDNLFNNITYLREGIFDIVIIGKNGNAYSKSGHTYSVQKYEKLLVSQNKPNYMGMVTIDSTNLVNKLCIITGMPVFSTDPEFFGPDNIGIAAIILDPNIFESTLGKIDKSLVQLYFLDKNQNIITSNTSENQGKFFDLFPLDHLITNQQKVIMLNDRRCIIQTRAINNIGGMIISITYEKNLLQEIIDLRLTVILIFVLSLALISIPFFFTVNNILQPIKAFMSFMSGINGGNLKTLKKRLKMDGYSEMTVMAHEFNQMLDEIDGLTHRLLDTNSMLYKVELEKKQAELHYLQSQINPHFLYNTIESIKAMAKIEEVYDIYEMTKALGRILRYGVKGADEVKLSEELNIVKAYVMIQKMRFLDRFNIDYQISPQTMDCTVLKMILQPMVENAIFHGIEPTIKKCNLLITSEIDESNTLVICVKDDGIGINIDTLNEIRNELDSVNTDNMTKVGAGIGVMNVNNRIKLKWGNAYGISIDSELNKGTAVVIRIPVRG